MYEIELKAHIDSVFEIEERVKPFAQYLGACEKSDVYWSRRKPGTGQKEISIRIREEKSEHHISCVATYKRKELRQDHDGGAYEVNDEQEFSIDNRSAFEFFLKDDGLIPVLNKHKRVRQWKTADVLIELCDVDCLGAFIELEILSRSSAADDVSHATAQLYDVMSRCGVPLSAVEPRYYSEMLCESGNGGCDV